MSAPPRAQCPNFLRLRRNTYAFCCNVLQAIGYVKVVENNAAKPAEKLDKVAVTVTAPNTDVVGVWSPRFLFTFCIMERNRLDYIRLCEYLFIIKTVTVTDREDRQNDILQLRDIQ